MWNNPLKWATWITFVHYCVYFVSFYFMDIQFCMIICVFVMNIICDDGEFWLTNISPLAILTTLSFKRGYIYVYKQIMCNTPIEIVNMNTLGKFLCTFCHHFYKFSISFVFAILYACFCNFFMNIIFEYGKFLLTYLSLIENPVNI